MMCALLSGRPAKNKKQKINKEKEGKKHGLQWKMQTRFWALRKLTITVPKHKMTA